ncbi:MAG: hypothetical protein OXU20_01270 [Myxococcales bacterium]|nr:hypothetical protein [Myxococcales bacterium]MDD9971077.1 hypothetical protein [Myxococcales bacterium]
MKTLHDRQGRVGDARRSSRPVTERPLIESRRGFLVGALASMPALAYLYGCEGRVPPADAARLDAPLRAGEGGASQAALARLRDPSWADLSARERRRRLWLRWHLLRHVQEENEHDLDGIMRTMATDAEMIVNGQLFDTPESIRAGHTEFGMAEMMGGLVGTEVVLTQEYFTDDAILTRGHLNAQHVGPAAGFPGAGLEVQLAYAAFYQFNRRGRLVSERITMDWGPLLAGLAAQAGVMRP